MNVHSDASRFGDPDPLDAQLAEAQGQTAVAGPWWALRTRLALGMAPTPQPGLVLLSIGFILGPESLDLLSLPVLAALEPVVSVALAALGVLVGLGLRLQHPRDGRLFAGACLQGAITMAAVAAGVLAVEATWPDAGIATWVFAVLVALCASASSSALAADAGGVLAMRISDLDDVLPIVLGGVMLATVNNSTASQPLGALGVIVAYTGAIALAGGLLVQWTPGEHEQRTFVAGTLLLLGGGAAYLAQSALFVGLVAGVAWNISGGHAGARVARDIQSFQQPPLVLLLLMAGATIVPSTTATAIAIVYVLCRVIGKLAGGWLVGRFVARDAVPGLGLALLSPGVVGIAFAMNVAQVDRDPTRGAAVLAVVAVGTLASELLSLGARHAWRG